MNKELEDKINLGGNIFTFGVVVEFDDPDGRMEPDEVCMDFNGKLYVMRLPREVGKAS